MAYTTIDDPSAYFHVNLHSGNGTNNTDITFDANAGDFQPDWIWFKGRTSSAIDHALFDSSRGTTKILNSNNTNAENAQGATLKVFNSNGFRVGDDAGDYGVNASGRTYVTWNWKANGGTRTTFSASGNQLAGGYQANTTAGFSIVDYTGNATNGATFPHGLGATPVIAIIKDRTNAGDGGGTNWIVVSTAQDGSSDRLYLNGTNAKFDLSGTEFRADFDSSNITLGTWNNVNASGTHIAYVFTPIQGYSKFGSYTGNGSTDGAFIYTGFKPAWLMTKNTQNAAHWHIWDNRRTPFNANDENLVANTSQAENSAYAVDFLSNGWKARVNDEVNNSGQSFIYMAFAEQPFVSSEGVPCTAR